MKNPVTLTSVTLTSLIPIVPNLIVPLISKKTTHQSDKQRFCCPTIHQKTPVFIPIYTSIFKPNRQSYTNPIIKKKKIKLPTLVPDLVTLHCSFTHATGNKNSVLQQLIVQYLLTGVICKLVAPQTQNQDWSVPLKSFS